MSQSHPVLSASSAWIANFNQGSALACAAAYSEDASLSATPFGRFSGRTAIHGFWHNMLDIGLSDLVYEDVRLHVIDDNRVLLSANWSMNKASGVISKELWVREHDNIWRLVEDDFTVLAQVTEPKIDQ
jgi:ketosteroid isomerase-like protein